MTCRSILYANPAGLASPDQSTPKELKNPIHLKTRDLIFNKESGNASTDARVEFRTPQATGWAVGVKYAGKSNTLTLSSQIHVVLNGPNAAVIEADHGIITNDPREIVLDRPHLSARRRERCRPIARCFISATRIRSRRVVATGNVTTETRMQAQAAASRGREQSCRQRRRRAERLRKCAAAPTTPSSCSQGRKTCFAPQR